MRLLGVDFGSKRTGLAIGDTSPFFVELLKTIATEDMASVVRAVTAEIEIEAVEGVVVGLPTSLRGHEGGDTLEQVTDFVRRLSLTAGVPVSTEDERFTSVLAERMRREYGVSSSRKFDLDAVAAALILETYIERISLAAGRAPDRPEETES